MLLNWPAEDYFPVLEFIVWDILGPIDVKDNGFFYSKCLEVAKRAKVLNLVKQADGVIPAC